MYHSQLSRIVGTFRQVDFLMYGNYFEGSSPSCLSLHVSSSLLGQPSLSQFEILLHQYPSLITLLINVFTFTMTSYTLITPQIW